MMADYTSDLIYAYIHGHPFVGALLLPMCLSTSSQSTPGLIDGSPGKP